MNFKPTYKTKSSLFNKALNKKKGLKNSRSFAAGGPIKPYYTSNPNDPRIRSYNDSLSTYHNVGLFNQALQGLKKQAIKEGAHPSYDRFYINGSFSDYGFRSKDEARKALTKYHLKAVDLHDKYFDNLRYPPNRSTGEKLYFHFPSTWTDDPTHNAFEGTAYYMKFPFPKQQVVYQPKPGAKPLTSTTSIYKPTYTPTFYKDPKIVEKQKLLKEAGLYSGALDGIWGEKSKEAWKKYEESKKTGSTTTTTAKTSTVPTTTSSTERIDRSLYDPSKPWSIPLLPKETNKSTTSSTTTTTKPTTSAVTRTLPPAPKINPDDPWRFMLGNQAYVTYDEPTAQQFAKELGITNLQRGQNLNIDPTTGKYRDYSHLLGKDASGTMTSKEITKYPKLKMMERGGKITKGAKLSKLYKAFKLKK